MIAEKTGFSCIKTDDADMENCTKKEWVCADENGEKQKKYPIEKAKGKADKYVQL